MLRALGLVVAAAGSLASVSLFSAPVGGAGSAGPLRAAQIYLQLEPVAVVRAPKPGSVFVGRADGSLFRFDGGEKVLENRIMRSMSDLIALDDGTSYVAANPQGDALVMLRGEEGAIVDEAAAPLPDRVLQIGDRLVLASVWGRSIARIRIARTGDQPGDGYRFERTVSRPLELAFSPREMIWIAERGWLVVADAFGGKLGVVDTNAWKLLGVRELPAHNIRGLCLTEDQSLLVAHQILDPLAYTSSESVAAGKVVRNVVREIPFEELLEADDKGEKIVQLGKTGAGAGDPSSVTRAPNGDTIVTLAGTDELLVVDAKDGTQRRFPTGRRPVDAVSVDRGRTWYVANGLGDSVTIVDVEKDESTTIPLAFGSNPWPEDDLYEPGRSYFYDARLSADGSMSCHSCHSEGHTSSGLADTPDDGSRGTPKLVPSLLGCADTAPYTWSGRQPTLEAEIEATLRETMHARVLDERTVTALVEYLRSLAPPLQLGARAALTSPAAIAAAERGRKSFSDAGCLACHMPRQYTTPKVYDVGTLDEAGLREFNPPSLLGAWSRGRHFHDGSQGGLAEIVEGSNHPGLESLGAEERADLLVFLRTL